MKKIVSIFVPLLLLCAVSFGVSAQTETEEGGMQKELLADAVEKMERSGGTDAFQFSETAQEIADGTYRWDVAGIWDRLTELFFGEIRRNLSALVRIVLLAVIAGVLCNLQGSFQGEGIANVSFLVCFIVIAGLSAKLFAEIVQTTAETIDHLLLFMQGLIPTITGIIAVSGGGVSGAALSPTLLVCMQLITHLAKNVFLPMLTVLAALSVVNNMGGRFHVSKLLELARQALKWASGIVLTVFIGILGIQGFSAAFVNGVAGKTVKYAVSNFVPLVGGILSDSVETVCASASIVKNTMGITGILALVSLCVGPLIRLLVVSVLYRFAAGIVEPAADRRIVGLLGDIAGNLTQAFVVLLTVCVMFVISVAILCAATSLPMMMR